MLTGERVSKAHPRVEAYGAVDELNALIGIVRMELERIPRTHRDGGERATVRRALNIARQPLETVQQELFDVGAELAGTPAGLPAKMGLIGSEQADRLVDEMDTWNEGLKPLESFILPAGSAVVATLHLARTVARRCERGVCRLREEDEAAVRDVVVAYLNRLSDWLFVLSRVLTLTLDEDEVLWTPIGKRD